jgi:hypothetical protein
MERKAKKCPDWSLPFTAPKPIREVKEEDAEEMEDDDDEDLSAMSENEQRQELFMDRLVHFESANAIRPTLMRIAYLNTADAAHWGDACAATPWREEGDVTVDFGVEKLVRLGRGRTLSSALVWGTRQSADGIQLGEQCHPVMVFYHRRPNNGKAKLWIVDSLSEEVAFTKHIPIVQQLIQSVAFYSNNLAINYIYGYRLSDVDIAASLYMFLDDIDFFIAILEGMSPVVKAPNYKNI